MNPSLTFPRVTIIQEYLQYLKQFLSQFQNVQNCNDDIISVNIFLKFSFYWILLSNIGASVYLYEEPSMWKEMWKVDNPRAAAINLRKNFNLLYFKVNTRNIFYKLNQVEK